MIDLQLIGIGTGNPDHLTRAAERAMQAADLLLLPRKRADTADLLDLRQALCTAVAVPGTRIATFDLPERDAAGPYEAGVTAWHDAIAAAWARAIATHLPHGGRLALLVWGDPSLYDSSLRIVERLRAGGMAMRVGVVPGITSLQALTAAHAIPLNTVGAPVTITTGRRLRACGWPEGTDTTRWNGRVDKDLDADAALLLLQNRSLFQTICLDSLWTRDNRWFLSRVQRLAGPAER